MHIAISRGLARYLEDVEGFDDESFEIVHYGIDPNGEPKPYAGRRAAPALRRPPDPDQGPHRPAARVRGGAAASCRTSSSTSPGRGPLEPALKALARELGVADAVRFLGHVSPIQAAIERAAVVVVPSMGEGFGMVALEAMERSRPVIAAAIGGLGELVRDGETGLLVPARRGRAARARRSCASPATSTLARAMGEAGRRRALSRFLQTFCTERTELLYEGALERTRDGRAQSERVRVDGRAVGHAGDRELAQRPLAAGRAERRAARAPGDARPRAPAGSSGGHEEAGLAVDDELRQRADARRDDGQPGEHRLEHAEPEALPARRVDEHRRPAEPRRDVGNAPEEEDAPLDAELARELLEPAAPGPSPSTTSTVSSGGAASARIATSIPFCCVGARRRAGCARRRGRRRGFSPHASGRASRP